MMLVTMRLASKNYGSNYDLVQPYFYFKEKEEENFCLVVQQLGSELQSPTHSEDI